MRTVGNCRGRLGIGEDGGGRWGTVGNRTLMAALDAGYVSAGYANAGCARSWRLHW